MSFVIAGNSASTGYNLTRSLRFRASAGGHLSKTFAAAGDQKTFTISDWLKRGALGIDATFFASVTDANNFLLIYYQASTDKIIILGYSGGSAVINISTSAVFRDPSAWYHIVFAFDTTQATGSNRVKLWVNNTQQALTFTTTPSLNLNALPSTTRYIGRAETAAAYFDGYLAEINFIDGQALTPSSFGSTNATTGVWQPARYGGTYGTNGFYLPFTDNSTAAALGTDFSGNSNTWTTNNISITAGVTYDSMTDVPTLTSATAANFPTLNPLNSIGSSDISAGNLTRTGGNNYTISTMGMPSGKWYAEMTVTTVGTESSCGVATAADVGGSGVGNNAWSWGYFNNGNKYNNGVSTSYGASYTSGDVIGIAFDNTIGTLTFYKNNVSQGAAFTSLSANTYFFAMEGRTGGTPNNVSINFGQRPFTYTPPSGFVALNTYNLPTSTIVKGNTVMDATLYTGTGATQVVTNAAGFKPDLLWVKARSRSSSHDLVDSVRGVNLALTSNSTQAEITGSFINSLNSNGFTLPANTLSDAYFTNVSGDTLVGWQWQAGQGSSSSNTNGSITSTVSVNASAGFSVVTYTGNGTNGATAGHGLGVTPGMVLIKQRNSTGSWIGWHQSISQAIQTSSTIGLTGYTGAIYLNLTNASSTYGFDSQVNGSGSTYVAYCWSQISGFSSFGSYVGNGSAAGPFVYLGFRPAFVMVKASSTTSNWSIMDNKRTASYNSISAAGLLYPNLSNAEAGSGEWIDFLSNGFKIVNAFGDSNSSGVTYIYAAFAETPFKNSLAR
jgi:hypothetical protein